MKAHVYGGRDGTPAYSQSRSQHPRPRAPSPAGTPKPCAKTTVASPDPTWRHRPSSSRVVSRRRIKVRLRVPPASHYLVLHTPATTRLDLFLPFLSVSFFLPQELSPPYFFFLLFAFFFVLGSGHHILVVCAPTEQECYRINRDAKTPPGGVRRRTVTNKMQQGWPCGKGKEK